MSCPSRHATCNGGTTHTSKQKFRAQKIITDTPSAAGLMIYNYRIWQVFTGTLKVKDEDEGEGLPAVGWQEGLRSFV